MLLFPRNRTGKSKHYPAICKNPIRGPTSESCPEAISVFQEDDADHFRKLEDFPVQKKVHSLAVDVETHRVYVPEQEEDGKPVSRMMIYDAVK